MLLLHNCVNLSYTSLFFSRKNSYSIMTYRDHNNYLESMTEISTADRLDIKLVIP